jgi:arginase family enzyme
VILKSWLQLQRLNQRISSKIPRYAEIASFMRAARAEIAKPLDIALVGVPLDLGATYRSGARQGPSAVREASRLIRQVNPTTKVAPYQPVQYRRCGRCADPSLKRGTQR